MFKETVCIRIPDGEEEKYRKRAEELGYVFFYKSKFLYKNMEIILRTNGKYEIYSYHPLQQYYKTITEKEFFGVNMFKKLDLEVLNVLVSLTCETLNSFSAYDVTTILRSRLPNFNIIHEDVRKTVIDYANSNKLTSKDNGTYIVYSNNVSLVTKTPSKTVTTSPNSFILQPKEKTKLEKLLEQKTLKTIKTDNITEPLQSEGRLNLTSLVKKYFPGFKQVYVTREPNSILITNNPYKNSSVLKVNPEIRIRTGFKTDKVNILVKAGKVEITPC